MARMTALPNTPVAAARMLAAGWSRLADILWPPVCGACEAASTVHGALCPACWDKVTFLGRPQCAACGVPLPYDLGPEALCGDCARQRPRVDRARAAFVYDDASRPMILAFKHADRTDLAPALVGHLLRPARPLLADADLIVPVPLHWRRLLARRYNQATLLANGLSARSGVPSVPDMLVRVKATPPQGGLGRLGRARNVKGAFRVRLNRRGLLAGKRVLLVDDVMTTGATLDAAARVLLRGGASAVDAITIAPVVLPGL